MTTSNTPWSTLLDKSGWTYLIDREGNRIGLFKDPRDADLVVEQTEKITDLEGTIFELENELARNIE